MPELMTIAIIAGVTLVGVTFGFGVLGKVLRGRRKNTDA